MRKLVKYILLGVLWLLPISAGIFTLLLRADKLKWVNKNQPIEIIADMDNGVNLDAQSKNVFFKHKSWERLKPENAVPVSGDIYRIEQNDIEGSAANGDNPLEDSELLRKYGKHLFETHCAVCHNHNLDGMGSILTKVKLKEDEDPFPFPPDIREKGKDVLPDSRIFHILCAGQNLMMPVSNKLNDNDKWAIILYIRVLQDAYKKNKTSK